MTGTARLAALLAATLFTIISSGADAGVAACGSTSECLTAVEAAHRDLRSLTARVVQTKRLSLLDEPLVSVGRLAFKRPDKLVWEIEEPDPMRIVIDGGALLVPGLSAADRDAIAGAPAATMIRQLGAIFTGDVTALQDGFDVTAAARMDDAGAIELTLVPRRDALRRSIERMELEFAGPQLLVRTIRLRNPLGDTLELELRDVQRNVDVPDTEFVLDGAS